MSIEAWKQFYQLLEQDKTLQQRLTAAYHRDMAIALLIQLGKEKGYSFTASDIEEAIASARRELSESELEAVAGGQGMAFPQPWMQLLISSP